MSCLASFRGLLTPTLALAALACQRLPDGPAAASSPGVTGNPSGGPADEGGTFLPTGGSSGGQGEVGDPTGECDPVSQAGCGASEKCTIISSGGALEYKCVLDEGFLDPLANCSPDLQTGIDGCPAGYACIPADDGSGTCLALCVDSESCEDAACLDATTDNIPFCAPTCSPFAATCPPALECRRTPQAFACQFADEADIGGPGAECSLTGDAGCATGFACMPGALIPGCETGNCCTNLCDLDDPDPCAPPSTCTSVFGQAAPGFENVGACFVPA